jgi:hypothetical protein
MHEQPARITVKQAAAVLTRQVLRGEARKEVLVENISVERALNDVLNAAANPLLTLLTP